MKPFDGMTLSPLHHLINFAGLNPSDIKTISPVRRKPWLQPRLQNCHFSIEGGGSPTCQPHQLHHTHLGLQWQVRLRRWYWGSCAAIHQQPPGQSPVGLLRHHTGTHGIWGRRSWHYHGPPFIKWPESLTNTPNSTRYRQPSCHQGPKEPRLAAMSLSTRHHLPCYWKPACEIRRPYK